MLKTLALAVGIGFFIVVTIGHQANERVAEEARVAQLLRIADLQHQLATMTAVADAAADELSQCREQTESTAAFAQVMADELRAGHCALPLHVNQ